MQDLEPQKSSYALQDGQILRIRSGVRELATLHEDWETWFANPGVLPNLILTGFGTPALSFEIVSQQLQVYILLETEVGILKCPKNIQSNWDHCVSGNYLIPLRSEEIDEIFSVLEVDNVQLGESLRKSDLFRLTRDLKRIDLKFFIPDDIERFTSNNPTSSDTQLLVGEPFPYQLDGINWLCDYYENHLGAMLCDEMGLGKTYQAMGLISHVLQKESKPVLICCPATLIKNWRNEINQFLPSLEVLEHFGPSRTLNLNKYEGNAVILTSYELLIKDSAILEKISWQLVFADEAQALKNRHSQRHKVFSTLQARMKILITGTPIENSLSDLWALSNLVYPDLLGPAKTFEALVEDTPEEARRIGRIAKPLILRRLVKDVAKDLPELIEIQEEIVPTDAFSLCYEEIRSGLVGPNETSNFLVILGRLIQACCYPGFIDPSFQDDCDSKFIRLSEILDELHQKGTDKVLIFSTYTKSIDLIWRFVGERYGQDLVEFLNGEVPINDRQQMIDAFNNSDGFRVLIVNPKAGGAGLNITGANHVIHFNRQWNPAVEKQATARAYRRKQLKTVFVRYFYYSGTVEEVINERLSLKLALSDAALENALSKNEELFRAKALLISPSLNN
jgi:SNF2 family DNA or RNA helicase